MTRVTKCTCIFKPHLHFRQADCLSSKISSSAHDCKTWKRKQYQEYQNKSHDAGQIICTSHPLYSYWSFQLSAMGTMVGINPSILHQDPNINTPTIHNNNLDPGIWFETIISWKLPYGITMQANNRTNKSTQPLLTTNHETPLEPSNVNQLRN